MKNLSLDIEKGLGNRLYRLVKAFVPVREVSLFGGMKLDYVEMGWTYGHGNTYLQTGRVLPDDEYLKLREKVLTYDFGI